MNINVINSKIVNLYDLLDYVNASADYEEINSLYRELETYISNKSVNAKEARILSGTLKARMANLDLIRSHGEMSKVNNGRTPYVKLPQTSISNRAGVMSMSFLLASLVVTAIMIAFLILA